MVYPFFYSAAAQTTLQRSRRNTIGHMSRLSHQRYSFDRSLWSFSTSTALLSTTLLLSRAVARTMMSLWLPLLRHVSTRNVSPGYMRKVLQKDGVGQSVTKRQRGKRTTYIGAAKRALNFLTQAVELLPCSCMTALHAMAKVHRPWRMGWSKPTAWGNAFVSVQRCA